jgi:hypothetical protein
LSTRNTPHSQNTHKLNVKGWEKITRHVETKTMQKYNADFSQNQSEEIKTVTTYKGYNSERRYYNFKDTCTKHQCSHIHKTNSSELKGTDRSRQKNSE